LLQLRHFDGCKYQGHEDRESDSYSSQASVFEDWLNEDDEQQ